MPPAPISLSYSLFSFRVMGALPISIGSRTDRFDGPRLELHFGVSVGGFYGAGTLALSSAIRTRSRIPAAHSPVALYVTASLVDCTVGVPLLLQGAGFLADPRRLPWYHRLSPVLFLVGPLAAACLNLATLVKLEARQEAIA